MNSITKKSTLLIATAALAAMSFSATGCATTSSADDKPSASTQSVTKVKIGVGVPLTQGVVAFGQGAVRATRLAVDEANKSDRAKELGIQFEVVEGDDQGDPKVGVNAANTFASDPSLVGVVGHINSGVNIPASRVYNEARIVNITPGATNPALTEQGFDNIFRTTTIDTVQGSFAADAAFGDLGLKTAYVIDDSSPYGAGLADNFALQYEKDGGTVVGREKTSDKDTEFSALATKIKSANPEVIYYGGVYNAGALLARQVRAAGVKAAIIGGDGFNDAEYIKIAGPEAAKDSYTTGIGLPLDDLPKGQEFKAAYLAAFPDKEISATDPYAYDAANVIIAGVLTAAEQLGADKVTGPSGREAIIKAVAATNTEGLTGKVAFDEKGDSVNKSVTLNVVNGEAWVPYRKK